VCHSLEPKAMKAYRAGGVVNAWTIMGYSNDGCSNAGVVATCRRKCNKKNSFQRKSG